MRGQSLFGFLSWGSRMWIGFICKARRSSGVHGETKVSLLGGYAGWKRLLRFFLTRDVSCGMGKQFFAKQGDFEIYANQ